MNIPAKYCTGFMGDIGVRANLDPMDYSGWVEVYSDRAWYKPTLGTTSATRQRLMFTILS